MNRSQLVVAVLRRKMIFFVGVIAAAIAAVAGMWMVIRLEYGFRSPAYETEVGRQVPVTRVKEVASEDHRFHSHTVPPSSVGSIRQPLQFRAKAVEPVVVLVVLANGKQTVEERVQQVQTMRGVVLAEEERDSIMSFFAGTHVPAGMGKGSMQWLADELMTVLRLQQPPQENLAAELGKIAFQSGTDPVVRDYLMQHLGHLWEQFGAREEIEKSLWLAVASSDETTPGSALIALSRGYQRDQQPENLQKVRERAFALLQNPATGLAVQVTALAIAGEGGSQDVKAIAQELAGNEQTPLILKRVAERIAGK